MDTIKGERARSVRVLQNFSEKIEYAEQHAEEELELIKDFTETRFYSEKAWVLMLTKKKIITQKEGAALLKEIINLEGKEEARDNRRPVFTPSNSFSIWSLEKIVAKNIGPDLAGNINIGKTLPEPHARLKIRDKIIDTLDQCYTILNQLLSLAESNCDTVMPGYTHMAQAQPMTFGHYLLSFFDPLLRATEDLNHAFSRTNVSTLGCGALSGSSWPLDRKLVSDLLGFNGIIENSNDAVAAGDFCLNTLASLVSVMVSVSRLTLDLQVWGMEEIHMIGVPESYSDTSSMMPQKKNYGGQIERIRLDTAKIIGSFQEAAVMIKNEPLSDMLAVLRMRYPALEALCIVEKDLDILGGFLSTIIPDKEQMYELAKKGFSAAVELANEIVRKKKISYRQAHHIVGTLVRLSDERKIRADEVDASILDEAAMMVIGSALNFDAEQVRKLLDPRNFVNAQITDGCVSPKEVLRMCKSRKVIIEAQILQQEKRKKMLQEAREMLQTEIDKIIR